MHLQPSPRQRELIAIARRLARERLAPRAERHDREASFPFDDYADLRAEGLLGLCVPERYGGLGADYETYCLVAEQLAQGDASTALTFNMHCLVMLMMGPIADAMAMPLAMRERHERLRTAKYREVVEEGAFYGQPHSEPVEQGETDATLAVGGRRFGTTARKVEGGYVVNGRKFFVSLAGAAPYYATPAIRPGDEPWIERTLYLQVPKDAPGVSFPGDWDPMGMRATVSRDMALENVFVPDDAEVLPPGLFGAMYNAFPHLFLSFSATFLGIMQVAYDGAIAYLTGGMPGAPARRAELAAKGPAITEMLFAIEGARALFYRAISEAEVDPPPEAVQRARAAHVTIQRAVVAVTQEAIRIGGGRAFLKRYPLERYARDARAAALMRPWTQELAMQQAWEVALGLVGQPEAAATRNMRNRKEEQMSVELNHTIIPAKDKWEAAKFLADILNLEAGPEWGYFVPIKTANGVTLDFATREEFRPGHYAFLVSDPEFDAAFARIRALGARYYADPRRAKPGEINHLHGGRGVYFDDPSGHLMEIITHPYGDRPEQI